MTDSLISPADLKIEIYPSRPTGGQHVGAGESGIRITHLPTGIKAICATDRSSHRNKRIALDMIEAALTSPHMKWGSHQ